MTYFKPELLLAEAALEAIRGLKTVVANDADTGDYYTTVAAYEVDE
jgi:hypothetical protein